MGDEKVGMTEHRVLRGSIISLRTKSDLSVAAFHRSMQRGEFVTELLTSAIKRHNRGELTLIMREPLRPSYAPMPGTYHLNVPLTDELDAALMLVRIRSGIPKVSDVICQLLERELEEYDRTRGIIPPSQRTPRK